MTCPTPHKVRHETKKSAVGQWRSLRAKGGSVDLMPYRCGDHWHVGHSAYSLGYRIRAARRRWKDA